MFHREWRTRCVGTDLWATNQSVKWNEGPINYNKLCEETLVLESTTRRNFVYCCRTSGEFLKQNQCIDLKITVNCNIPVNK